MTRESIIVQEKAYVLIQAHRIMAYARWHEAPEHDVKYAQSVHKCDHIYRV